MKKTLVCLLSLVAALGFSQNVLLRFYSGNPKFPDGWPSAVKYVPHQLVEPGWTTNMTETEYIIYRLNLQPLYNQMVEQEAATLEEARQNRLAALRNIFSAIAVFENDWNEGSNYNNAQLLTVIKTHNRALQNLAPILRDLYNESQTR